MPGIETKMYKKIFPAAETCLRCDLQSKRKEMAFLEDENVFYFAPVFLQRRVTTTVAIINPQTIPITVDFNILPIKAVKQAKVVLPFEISDREVELGPNETKNVELSFLPITQEEFTAVFEAVVRNGFLEETKALRFTIEGTGTLPTVCSLGQIDAKPMKGSSCNINVGRTLVGLFKDKGISVMNNGLIDAKITVTAKENPAFTLKGVTQGEEIVLEPGRIVNMTAIFEPVKAQRTTFEILVSVLENPKANLSLMVTGEGFVEDVMFDGLSEDDQSLVLRDCIVGRQAESKFVMKNVSNSDIRFAWTAHNDFVFTPSVGHLRVGTSKEIRVSFFSEKPTKYNGLKFSCQWSKIHLNNPAAPDWDDSMKMIKYVPRGSLSPKPVETPSSSRGQRRNVTQKKAGALNQSPRANDNEIVKVAEVKPEPSYEAISGKYKDLQMKISAISDVIKYTQPLPPMSGLRVTFV